MSGDAVKSRAESEGAGGLSGGAPAGSDGAGRPLTTDGPGVDAVILAGGRGSRLGGVDKAALRLAGERLVDRVAAAARRAGARRIVVVGPETAAVDDAERSAAGPDSERSGAARDESAPARRDRRDITVVREDPPFSGPLAALDAGLAVLPDCTTWVLLLSCDLVDPDAVCEALRAEFAEAVTGNGAAGTDSVPTDTAQPDAVIADAMIADAVIADGITLRDPDGRNQWLAGIYRVAALRAALQRAAPLANRPLKLAFSGLRLEYAEAPFSVIADIDEPEELARARRRFAGPGEAIPSETAQPGAPATPAPQAESKPPTRQGPRNPEPPRPGPRSRLVPRADSIQQTDSTPHSAQTAARSQTAPIPDEQETP